MNKQFRTTVFLISGCLLGTTVIAQEPKGKTIDVTSTFKPVLREASKINFNATEPAVDTTKPRLNYNIPAQNLFFTYQPAGVHPVALKADSVNDWVNSNYIKAGIGNIHQPFIKAGFSFGDGQKTFFNIFGNHYTSKGELPFQKNSQTSVGAAATYKTSKNLEWNGSLGFRSDDYYLYGFKPDSLAEVFTKDDLKQKFQTIEGKIDFRNIAPTEFGLNFHPSIRVSGFNGTTFGNKATETNTVLNLPLEKTFGDSEKFAFNIGATADLTNYKNDNLKTDKKSIQNNLYQIATAVSVKTGNLYLHAGILPSWDQKKFHMLPNVMADITTNDKQLTLQLGWVGSYSKGSYQRFASINPWLAQPDSLLNTRTIEMYGGIKGSLGDHFTYSAKLGLATYHNMPLFVNDTLYGNTFNIRYEPKMNNLRLHSEIAYTVGEKFTASGGLTWNNYYKQEREADPYGLIPIELNAAIRWQLLKDLFFYSELWTWTKPKYLSKNGDSYKGDNAFDLNAGAEFRITRNFNLWVQLNNLLNDRYQRWNQYEVFGFSILGGITYSFNTK
ncbi:hypothetical protein [Longitalea arenae]|uniref:hypothetical protein n=1 Tax=Longitalea arenae TaxID=2812558 RepID=UPI001967FB54|nr:hypothetical protein [Longitalea arenae]